MSKRIPNQIKVNKKDIVVFDDFSCWCNLSTVDVGDGNILLKKIKGIRKYKSEEITLFDIISDPFFVKRLIPYEEKNSYRKFNNLVYLNLAF